MQTKGPGKITPYQMLISESENVREAKVEQVKSELNILLLSNLTDTSYWSKGRIGKYIRNGGEQR